MCIEIEYRISEITCRIESTLREIEELHRRAELSKDEKNATELRAVAKLKVHKIYGLIDAGRIYMNQLYQIVEEHENK